ncbi:MAG: Gfo/Idh/MocA family oxidoreductase [Thermoanaerobaculia bacterium]
MSDLRAGVFGIGALGRHHTRILSTLPGVELCGIFDTNSATAAAVAAEYGATVAPTFEDLADRIDIAVLAAPTSLHGELGLELLRRGVHLMVEKPIASTLAEADALIAAADAAGKVLAVGHVEFHNPAVQALLDTPASPRFVEIERLGTFSPRSLDVDVILDLMIHDLQILQSMDSSPVIEVRATGIAVLSERIDIANARIAFESGLVANVTASRISAERVRKIRAFFADRYLSLDYQAQEIKGYRLDTSAGARAILPANPPVTKAEPLHCELSAFVASCLGKSVRQVDGKAGRQALATALEVVAAAEPAPRASRA